MKPTYDDLLEALEAAHDLAVFYQELSDAHECLGYYEADLSEEEIQQQSAWRISKWASVYSCLNRV